MLKQTPTGEDLLREAEKHLGDPYILGADVPLKLRDNYHGKTDCAEFATMVVQDVTGKIYGALRPKSKNPDPWTGEWFAQVRAGILIRIPVAQAIKTPGALLLRFDKLVHHIAFSDGRGGTVEARGKDYGVCRAKSAGRGWQYGILIPGVTYHAS